MTSSVLDEAERVRRVPGVYFVEDETGRHARVTGGNLEIREVIKIYRDVGWQYERLREALDWWPDEPLQTALQYYALYPEEIDAYLADEDAVRLEEIWERYPQTRPRH